ncbi:MAG: aminopeptidase P family N-terminal domain-containing protein [Caldilineaceae bacterium]
MRAELDRLMAERGLDAFLVVGDAAGNKVMNYLTGGAHLERALVLKRRNGPLTLVHGAMERDTAASTGLTLVDRDQHYNLYELLRKHEGNRLAAMVDYLMQVVEHQELQGRLGLFGMMDAGEAYTLFNQVQDRLEGTTLVGEFEDSLFAQARETKDDGEIDELVEAGRLTSLVVRETREFLSGAPGAQRGAGAQ